jgi:hypothetical protein
MSLTYDDAIAEINAVSGQKITLPTYTGGQYDLNYLHDYVLNIVEDFYGAPASEFATATEYSTTILRDFLNRAIYYQNVMPARANVTDIYPQYEDVAGLLRYPAGDQCGGTAFQMMQIYRSFGYQAAYVGALDGPVGTQGTAGAYTAGHVTTVVDIPSLDKWIVQDSYCNYTLRDQSGDLLSLQEARELAAQDPDSVVVDGIDQYLHWRTEGFVSTITPGDEAIIRSCLLTLQQSWFVDDGQSDPFHEGIIFDLFNSWSTAHTAIQGGTFATASAAVAGVMAAAHSAGFDWQVTAANLAGGHYVSGFELVSPDGSWVESQWITVQLADMSYVSVNVLNGQYLVGSYDQLVVEAAQNGNSLGAGEHYDLLAHANFIGANLQDFSDWISDNAANANVVVQHDDAGIYNWDTSTAQYTNTGALAHQIVHYDDGGWLNISYDLDSSQVWWDQQDRYDASAHLVAQRFDYDAGGYLSVVYDTSNQYIWSDSQARYNAGGKLEVQHTDYDAGGWLDMFYDNANQQVWSTAQYRYDANGDRDALRFDYDAGGYLKTYYDNTNSYVWSDAQYRYDSGGHLEASRFDLDVGGYARFNYDTTNTQVWSSNELDYNTAGQLTHQTFNYDAGGKLDIAYDIGHQHQWSSYQTKYDANGVIQAELIYNYDGTVVRHDFHDGLLIA